MYYIVCAESRKGEVAAKVGYAEHAGTLGKRIENAKKLLLAHGYFKIVHEQHGPADKKQEGAIHSAIRKRFHRPPTGPHGDGASECYLGASLTDCLKAMAEVGMGFVGELQSIRLQQGTDAALASWNEFARKVSESLSATKRSLQQARRARAIAAGLAVVGVGALVAMVVIAASMSNSPLPADRPGGGMVLAMMGTALPIIIGFLSLSRSNADISKFEAEVRQGVMRAEELLAAAEALGLSVNNES